MVSWRLGVSVLLVLGLLVPAAALGYPRDDAGVAEVDIDTRADIHRLHLEHFKKPPSRVRLCGHEPPKPQQAEYG